MIQQRWLPIMLKVGVVLMILGPLDPMEGSAVILPAIALTALAARLGRSDHTFSLTIGLVLAAIGIGALWGFSAIGGFGGTTGRSIWWGLTLLPYPLGWAIALVGGIRAWRDGLPVGRSFSSGIRT